MVLQPPNPENKPRKDEDSVIHKQYGEGRHVSCLDAKSHPVCMAHVSGTLILPFLLRNARHVLAIIWDVATLVNPLWQQGPGARFVTCAQEGCKVSAINQRLLGSWRAWRVFVVGRVTMFVRKCFTNTGNVFIEHLFILMMLDHSSQPVRCQQT